MQLIINHLTRLKTPDSICVAGLDLATHRHIRPVLNSRLITRVFLAERPNGYFGIGQRLDLGQLRPVPQPPFTEDFSFEPGRVHRLGLAEPAEFWQLLKQTAQADLRAIFGPELHPYGRGAAVNERAGNVSLGNLLLETPPRLWLDQGERGEILRLSFQSDPFDLNLSVTDLRFFQPDNKTPRKEVVVQVCEWLESGQPVILSMGLGRAFQKPTDTQRRHWLHVNNLHFEQQSIW